MKISKLKELNACEKAIDWCKKRNIKTVEEAWEKCERGDWMLWLYKNLYRDNLKELTLAKGHCANTVRHLMRDERSIGAVDAAIAFGEGRISKEDLNIAATHAAHAAYAADAAARAASAAYAAYASAASAATHAAYAATHAAYAAYAADAAAYAADAAADAAYADAYAAKKKQIQKLTADICRKYLKLKESE
jgi:hypothetical protein